LKFFVDMPVTPQAVAHFEAEGHDAIHASAVGFGQTPDSEILAAFGVGDRARVAPWQIGVYWAKDAGADLLAFTLGFLDSDTRDFPFLREAT
jgi:hypothetical protein